MTREARAPTILLVEDDDSLREVLAFNLEDAGFDVDAVDGGQAALEAHDPARHDAVLTDLRMSGVDGLELLRKLRERDPTTVVLLMTAYGALDVAVTAMQAGAFHYVEKPVNTPTLIAVLRRAVEFARLGREKRREGGSRGPIISTSPEMNNVLRLVDKVADSDATILIRGESGTGKELVAREVHERSQRSDRAFVAVNCSAIPSGLLESLLFGHERGAFTGAVKSSPGKFVQADGGTLFLDEIGEMAADLQARLLRVLQEGEVEAVGADKPRSVDVRIVAATHGDLELMVESGRFREDLFYRLNVVPISVPPLRSRRDDIPVLLRHFVRQHAPDRSVAIERQVYERLAGYAWPGNVRELENIAKRMVLLADSDELTVKDIPRELLTGAARSGDSVGRLPFELPEEGLDLRTLERDIIRAALAKHGGNQSAAARYLGLARHKLLYRMEKYGLKSDA